MIAWVFGYASLVALPAQDALPGRLHGYRRRWGVAMDNWEGGEGAKHYLDRATGKRPRIRVAYLDIERSGPEGDAAAAMASTVNGLAIPVDAARLAALDEREINYERVDVTTAFEPAGQVSPAAGEATGRPAMRLGAAKSGRIFTYVGTEAARERCRQAIADGDGHVSRDYLAGVREAFAELGEDASAEFDRTTDTQPLPLVDLQVVNAPTGY